MKVAKGMAVAGAIGIILGVVLMLPVKRVEPSTSRDRFVINCENQRLAICEVYDRKTKQVFVVAVTNTGAIIRLDQGGINETVPR